MQHSPVASRCVALRRLAMAAVNRVGGLAAGIANAIFVKFYQYVVDPAEADTWPFRLFAYLAKGLLRSACLHSRLASFGVYIFRCFSCPAIARLPFSGLRFCSTALLIRIVATSLSACCQWPQHSRTVWLAQREHAGVLCHLWGLHQASDLYQGQPQILNPFGRAGRLLQRESDSLSLRKRSSGI